MIRLVFSLFLCSSIGSVIIASGCRVQTTDIKILPRGYDSQCPSMEKERVLNEIHQIIDQVLTASVTDTYTCNGTPGWRCVAFINMTDTSYNCPTGLSLSSFPRGLVYIHNQVRVVLLPSSVLEICLTARYVGGYWDTSIQQLVHFSRHMREGKDLMVTMSVV